MAENVEKEKITSHAGFALRLCRILGTVHETFRLHNWTRLVASRLRFELRDWFNVTVGKGWRGWRGFSLWRLYVN
jgi:hypothetical protein